MTLNLREVLDHAVLLPADPVLLSGDDHLDHAVRWVHTADLYDIAPLLRGDELLLTNGVGLVGVDEAARRLYIRRLAECGVAGLFFEVGRTFEKVPPDMVAEARDVGLPIVELQPALRFTEVAEAVNSELIDQTVAQLRHADETSRGLSEALARGASLTELIEQVAVTVGTWARLSDYAGRLVVTSGTAPGEADSRAEVPVLVEGTAWGRLLVGTTGAPAVLVSAVLDRAPTVLGLCLIREQKDVAGALRTRQILLNQLVSNQPVDAGLLGARLRAAGLPGADHEYACIAVDPQRVEAAANILDSLVKQVGAGIFGIADGALCGVLARHRDDGSESLPDVLHAAVRAAMPAQSRLCATVGRRVRDASDLPRVMSETRETLALGEDLHVKDAVIGVQALALERLLSVHGDLNAMRQFVDDQIGLIEKADSAKGSQLAHTLTVLVECGGRKAEAAKRLHVRRQSLYYRLGQISRLLDVDLDDPKQLATVSVAVAARRIVYGGE
jgi:PucR family transcriptional regulator, purine catabolism regulatory protein